MYTPASDVYAYGVFLWELFTHQEAQSVKAYLSQSQPRSTTLLQEIVTLIRGCCAKDPRGRPTMSYVVGLLRQKENAINEKGKEEEEETKEASGSSLTSVGFSWGMGSKLPLFQHPKLANETQKKIRERRHSFS